MKNYLAVLLMLTLLLLSAACVNNVLNTPPPEHQPAIEAETPPEYQSPKTEILKVDKTPALPAKIAIITNDVTQNEEEFRSAQELISKYGEEKVVHKVWPIKFPEEREKMIEIVQHLAADPQVKALIINQCVQNSLAAVDKLLKTRDDIFLVAINPIEDPALIVQRFNLVLNADEIMMGEAMPIQAQKMGAKTFVHLSFPRHMTYKIISARYELLKKNCEVLGMEFVTYTLHDPTANLPTTGSSVYLLEEIPKLVEQYGKDTAFFCTTCALQVPLIKAVVDAGAIFPQPCCPSPFHGFPLALGLVSGIIDKVYEAVLEPSCFDSVSNSDILEMIIDQTIEKLAEKNMLGRVSTWPVPISMLCTYAAADYAFKWIEGEVPKEGIDIAVFEQCMADYANVQCFIRTLGTHAADAELVEGEFPNWLFLREEYIIYE